MNDPIAVRPLTLAVLGVLSAGPLHPYGIQKRLKEWGKDNVVELGQRAAFYKLITRLENGGLVTAEAPTRDARYPERTTYAITDRGRDLVQSWLLELLTAPRNEYPLFPAALSFVPMLVPTQLEEALRTRADTLQQQLNNLGDQLTQSRASGLFPVTLLDDHYHEAMLNAELHWVQTTIEELHRGELTWNPQEMIAAIPATET